ncbi:uroporphyrinogen-III synthase [Alteribacillus sp. HJP-4]|uniref:uroporphyrinogen-III synthase n=1 Tax=Alteribacillus sp. HJP-4 TaxID=2775394 RepID=UPI0035CCD717
MFQLGIQNIPALAEKLLNEGTDPSVPVMITEWGGMERQRSITGPLGSISAIVSQADLSDPAIIVLGNDTELHWVNTAPFAGKGMLAFPAGEQEKEVVKAFQDAGGSLYTSKEFTLHQRITSLAALDSLEMIKHGKADAIFLQNKTTAQILLKYLKKHSEKSGIQLQKLSFVCIGKETAQELTKHGLMPACIFPNYAETFLAESVSSYSI